MTKKATGEVVIGEGAEVDFVEMIVVAEATGEVATGEVATGEDGTTGLAMSL